MLRAQQPGFERRQERVVGKLDQHGSPARLLDDGRRSPSDKGFLEDGRRSAGDKGFLGDAVQIARAFLYVGAWFVDLLPSPFGQSGAPNGLGAL